MATILANVPLRDPSITVMRIVILLLALIASAEPPVKLPIGTSRPALNIHLLDGSAGPTWNDLKGKVVVIDF